MQSIDSVIYTGGASTDDARVGNVKAHSGIFTLPFIPPIPGPWDGREGTNPEELLAAAWAICFHGLLAASLRDRGADSSGSAVNVSVTLGQSEGGVLGLAAEIVGIAPEVGAALLTSALNEAYKRCPFCQAMDGNIRVNIRANS
ncbi:OsmC family protein [Gordonia sp. (in: high G+C Gram-positive bacteria)]|uniref:OsmC family protein n=1 Tax=Gordonia sp. (in: high G+C Gram-positive bacteria) TaxID=84139 RepID=UPI003313034D